ncbi:RNA polymerase sigma factor, partial [Streptococcus pyogenes]
QAAFEAIFQRYERQIYSFIYRMMGDPDDAYDLTQDCFVKAFRALNRTSDDLNVSAWLHRIASNACLDVLRRRQRLRW